MPRFPKKEHRIVALAENLWRGLWANRPIYQSPPVHPFFLRFKTLIYKNHRDTFLAKEAEAEQATTTKDNALGDLIEALEADIRYAENTVNYDDDKLKQVKTHRLGQQKET